MDMDMDMDIRGRRILGVRVKFCRQMAPLI